MSTLLSLFTGPNPVFFILGGALLASIISYMRGRVTGARAADAKRARDELKAREIRDRAQDEVEMMTPDQQRKEFGEWKRR